MLSEDGRALVELWIELMHDPTDKPRDRLEASRLLADRGWGKAPEFVPEPQPDESSVSEDPVFRTPTRERMRELIRLGIEMELPGVDQTITEGVMRVFDVLLPAAPSSKVSAGVTAP